MWSGWRIDIEAFQAPDMAIGPSSLDGLDSKNKGRRHRCSQQLMGGFHIDWAVMKPRRGGMLQSKSQTTVKSDIRVT